MPDGTCGRVVRAVRDRRIEAVTTWELAEELAVVLRRERIRRYGITEGDVREILALFAPLLPSVEVDVALRDPKDLPVVAAAIDRRAELIITGDKDLLDDAELRRWLGERRIRVVSAAEALTLIGDRSP